MYKHPALPSLARRIGVSALIGIVVAVLGSTLEAIAKQQPITSVASIDDIAVGIVVALVVFWYEQRRYRVVIEKLQMIATMNHHVRNALQAISFAPYAEQQKQIKLIQNAVNRIQWALREVLPGQCEPGEKYPEEQ